MAYPPLPSQYEFENRCRASCDDAALIDQPGVTLIHYTPGNYGQRPFDAVHMATRVLLCEPAVISLQSY